MRPIAIAFTVLIWAMVAWSIAGLVNHDTPTHRTCAKIGYAASDLGLAQCADHLGLPCGDPYTDHLREACP